MRGRPTAVVAILGATLVVVGCEPPVQAPRRASGRPPSTAASIPPGNGEWSLDSGERGEASYYAQSLSGRPTASGELYSPGAMTAAHRTLPFGTIVEVRRDDGRAVVVRINDRGPFHGGRVIDLSRRAAEELGMIRAGVINVIVRVIQRVPARSERRR